MEKIVLCSMFVLFMKGVFGETNEIVKIVNEGETVTLQTGLTEIKKDDVMDWMFKTKNALIARVRYNSDPIIYDTQNEEFKGRLKVDRQTGDLTITNFKPTDYGVYEVTNDINTFTKTFKVTVTSGETPGETQALSAGQIAGIVIGTGLLAALAVVGGIFYKKKTQVL